jgi:PAS domain S-box-containing protein
MHDEMINGSILDRPYRILIIDDNRAIHDDLRKSLVGAKGRSTLVDDEALLFGAAAKAASAARFKIESAFQGEEGLKMIQEGLAQKYPYSLAFVDVRMPPGWDGIETIGHLWEADPHLQVVICTAFSDYSGEDIQAKFADSHNLLVLKKPFDDIEVVHLAHALTQKWSDSLLAQAKLEDLALMVAQRTAELQCVNTDLRSEISERTKAEEAFRTIFETSPVGIALLDADFQVVSTNCAMEGIYGLEVEAMIGANPMDLNWFSTPDDLAEFLEIHALDPMEPREITVQHPDAGIRTALLWMRRVDILQVEHALCFLLDISRRKHMEEELQAARLLVEAATNAKSDFLAHMI